MYTLFSDRNLRSAKAQAKMILGFAEAKAGRALVKSAQAISKAGDKLNDRGIEEMRDAFVLTVQNAFENE